MEPCHTVKKACSPPYVFNSTEQGERKRYFFPSVGLLACEVIGGIKVLCEWGNVFGPYPQSFTVSQEPGTI